MKATKTISHPPRTFYEQDYPRGFGIAEIPAEDDFMYFQVLRQLRSHLRPGIRVLDLGCNNGNLSLYMAKFGCEVLGIDLAMNAIETAIESAGRLGIVNVTFSCLDFLGEWHRQAIFDFVLCSHVLEHVPDDGAFLKKVAFALKPEGTMLLIAPTVYSSLFIAAKLFLGRFAHDDEVGHLRRYSRQGITRIVRCAGFKLEKLVFLDSVIRDWFILCKPLRQFNRMWGQRYLRTVFNQFDGMLASFLFPAAICAHARKSA